MPWCGAACGQQLGGTRAEASLQRFTENGRESLETVGRKLLTGSGVTGDLKWHRAVGTRVMEKGLGRQEREQG